MFHHLKVHPAPFQQLWTGEKTFELRLNDRGFEVGDVVHLQEWSPETKTYSGRGLLRRITHMLLAGEFPGLQDGFCVLSLSRQSLEDEFR